MFVVTSCDEETVFKRSAFSWYWCNGSVNLVIVLIVANLRVLGWIFPAPANIWSSRSYLRCYKLSFTSMKTPCRKDWGLLLFPIWVVPNGIYLVSGSQCFFFFFCTIVSAVFVFQFLRLCLCSHKHISKWMIQCLKN